MKRIISNRRFIQYTIGVIYRQAPGHKPRNVDKIVDFIKNYFVVDCKDKESYFKTNDGYVSFRIEEEDLVDFIEECLMSCDDFRNLNLSQDEVDRGISVDDENRDDFVGIDRYTNIKEYYDFIDLDACIRNIAFEFGKDFLDDDLFDGKCMIVEVEQNEKSGNN